MIELKYKKITEKFRAALMKVHTVSDSGFREVVELKSFNNLENIDLAQAKINWKHITQKLDG